MSRLMIHHDPIDCQEDIDVGNLTNFESDSNKLKDIELFIRLTFNEDSKKGCELLFRRYYKVLCSHAIRFVYSKEIAEDIVSEVFCKFWKTKAFLNVTSSYRFYLFRAVRNEAYNYLRLEFTQFDDITVAEANASSNAQQPDSIAQYEEILGRLESIHQQLPNRCRKVFIMNRFESKRHKEIALELNISTKTVEAHMSKALFTIKSELKDYLN
jgi:RNA polymerase sigma-70 factor (family 1)